MGVVTGGAKGTTWLGLAAVAVTLLFLIALGKEGLICAGLVLPLIFLPMLVGVGLSVVFRRWEARRKQRSGTAAMLLMPILIFGAHWLERPMLDQVRTERVTSSVHVAADPTTTWALLQSFDSIHGPKPWLMPIGLPVPVRCTLERGAVGAKRVCYFEDGTIEERVAEWAPPNHMRLLVTHTHMGIHHWMGFQDAVYELRPDGNGTLLSRTTTLESALYPAWYWRPWERLGVEQEHRYILNDVVLRANDAATAPSAPKP